MKTLCVGYTRVSGKGQTQGTGLDRQEQAVRAYAKKNGFDIQEVYFETFTGTETGRPVFETMLVDLLDNGCRTILCECLDRIARDLSIQLQIITLLASKGITLINCMTGQDVTDPTDPMTKAMIQVQGAFAELDKNLLVRKLKKGRQAKRLKTGSCEGRKAFGTRPGEQETIARMKELYRKQPGFPRMSFCKIARVLNAEDHPTRQGGKWYGSTVKRIIEREGRGA